MKRLFQLSAACLLFWRLGSFAAAPDYYGHFLRGPGTNNQWSRKITVPVLIVTNSPKPQPLEISQIRLWPQIEIAGIHLGMKKDEVATIWGKPSSVQFNTVHKHLRLDYSDSVHDVPNYAVVDVLFDPKSNNVAAIWLTFPTWYETLSPTPKVEECLHVFGEPTARNYIPEPWEPRQEVPKHWYCRMIYKTTQPPMILYFADGKLMGMELNPRAMGVAPDGKGSDDYSIPFCLE